MKKYLIFTFIGAALLTAGFFSYNQAFKKPAQTGNARIEKSGQSQAQMFAMQAGFEQDKIRRLIDALRQSDIEVYVSGQKKSGKEAAAYFLQQYEQNAKKRFGMQTIANAQQFIAKVASFHSSGKPFMIKTKAGQEQMLANWLTQKLESL